MIKPRSVTLAVIGSLLISASGCTDSGLWGREDSVVMADLAAGRHEFLRHVDPGEIESAPIFRLHDGAGYFLGRVYQDLGMPELASRAFSRQIEAGGEPYRREAVAAVFEGGDSEDLERLVDLAELSVEEYPEDGELHRLALDSLYENRRYRAFTDILARSASELGEQNRARWPEVWLMEAVAEYEVGGDAWRDAMAGLFAEIPARNEHSRLFIYMHNHDGITATFTDAELELFRGKHALVEGRYRDAAEIYRRLGQARTGASAEQADQIPQRYVTAALARDMTRAFQRGRYYTVGSTLLGTLAADLGAREGSQAFAWTALLGRARLLQQAGRVDQASRVLETLLDEADGESFRREVFGVYLVALSRSDVDRIPPAMTRHKSLWQGRGTYNRFFEGLTADLVRSRDWFALARFVELAEENGRSDLTAQYRLVLAAAVDAGLYAPGAGSPFSSREDILEPLRDAESAYYRLMATALLNEDLAAVLRSEMIRPPAARPVPPALASADTPPRDPAADSAFALTQGYVQFGLLNRAYELGQRFGTSFPPGTLADLARRAASEGNLIVSIRLAERIRNEEYRRDVVELRFPLGFAADVEEVVETYDLDRSVFYGVIREESHFAPAIVSHAGAVGLAQLMPSTAEDVARRMRLSQYELTDPATNLALGAHYLSYLRGRFPSYLHALAAYNGGQGRVRQWMTHYGLQGILFHEAIPLAETRHYVRKVVVSAAYYGYVYEGRDPTEAIRTVFPSLDS
jgi:soluble lytic murein transglycosylase